MPRERVATPYTHSGVKHPVRPDIGVQVQFRGQKAPRVYRYDKSLDPALSWDAQGERDEAERLMAEIQVLAEVAARADVSPEERQQAVVRLRTAAAELRAMSRVVLNWAGKAERHKFTVPTLPLFVHERLSTQAVLESVRGKQRQKTQQLDLFADPGLDIADRILKAYEHQGPWVNRLILGDSLLVMNSLVEYEGLGGQVQMIYMDPPYGVRFNSNFQPFVRKREVKHNDDKDLTREPEMVRAYRDTWELGLHSYLTYLRDRLLLARELLHPSGSIFVQISDDNEHHVREILDEVFGPDNFVAVITFSKTSGSTSEFLPTTTDYLLWYARDRVQVKYHPIYLEKTVGGEGGKAYTRVELPDGTRRSMTAAERTDPSLLPAGSRIYRLSDLTSQSVGRQKGEGAASWFPVEFNGRIYRPSLQRRWQTNEEGMRRLIAEKRVEPMGEALGYVRYFDDFPFYQLTNKWTDTGTSGSGIEKLYVVQTSTKVVQRCMLMTTDPGDLVLDPTCGSGTTAYVAEQWGRRWIAIDVSRVPLALTRQRLLTATFPWYELGDPDRGPVGGFVYRRRRNARGEEVGGLVPHITLESIAQDKEPPLEILVDRPEVDRRIVRVAGPFTVEAVIPPASAPAVLGGADAARAGSPEPDAAEAIERIREALRQTAAVQLPGGRTVPLRRVRPVARALQLHAEAETGPEDQPERIAFTFGPERGPVTEAQVWEAGREAYGRAYAALYIIGFAIEDAAAKLVQQSNALPVPTTYVQATLDLLMGDLLKNTPTSHVFAAMGAPDIRLVRLPSRPDEGAWYQVELRGVDVFDPVTQSCDHRAGADVPCWMLDSDYDDLVFRADQVFFPRTSAWDHLKRALRAVYDDTVWDHLAGTVSEPFPAGEHGRVAVKVIDDRGNELLVTRALAEAEVAP